MEFANDNWYIEGDIEQQFSSFNLQVLVKLLKTKIDDQAFLDLVYKFLRAGYGNKMRINHCVLSPMLANIYMSTFDK